MKNAQCKYPNKLKELRVKAGITQKEVAKKLNLDCENRISRWEKGLAMPNVKNLVRLCEIYKVGLTEIYNLTTV